MSAFGSLALSNDPGTAEMGLLLTISLASTLFCTLFILPALLGPAAQMRSATRTTPQSVIPGLVPGIHVESRDKPGHDG
jgi:hypothetical protein